MVLKCQPRKHHRLLPFPPEIFLLIVSYVPFSRHSFENLELVSMGFRDLMLTVFRERYGQQPTPSKLQTHRDWKRFAIQYEIYRSEDDTTRRSVIDDFLKLYLDYPSHYNLKQAKEVIYYLHDNPRDHPRGVEAIIAALNVQNRRQDSKDFIDNRRDSLTSESKALFQARFRLHFTVSWSTCPPTILQGCLLAAAAGGNLHVFRSLRQRWLASGKDVELPEIAWAAIRCNRVAILGLLERKWGVRFDSASQGHYIQIALEFGSANALKFLLRRVTDPDGPYRVALEYCNIDAIRYLKKHFPHIDGTYLRDGTLQISFILQFSAKCCYAKLWANKSKLIEYLVTESSADLDATARDRYHKGLTAVHNAAIGNDLNALRLLHRLGANVASFGDVHQTAAEMALCNGHNISFIGCDYYPNDLLTIKEGMAQRIVRNYCDAVFRSQPKYSEFHHHLDDIESRLVKFWAFEIGRDTLQELCDTINTRLFQSVEKLLRIIVNFETGPVKQVERQSGGLKNMIVILENFLTQRYDDSRIARLACYSRPELTTLDIENLLDFVNSSVGRVMHTRGFSFTKEYNNVWSRFNRAIGRF